MKNNPLHARRTVLLSLVLFALLGNPLRAGTPAFTADAVSMLANFGHATFGYAFAIGEAPVLVSHLGIYDGDGNGFANSHELGLWNFDLPGAPLVGSSTIPAGVNAPLIDGYRYVPISPVMLQPGGHYSIGALFRDQDPDWLTMPTVGRSELAIRIPSSQAGAIGLGSELSAPRQWVCPGGEGVACIDFYPANFLFEVVPEPGVGWLLGLGGLALLLRRHGSRRRGAS